MIRSMPPASAHLADSPVPAPPPMMGRPAATWARRRRRHSSRVKELMGTPGGGRGSGPDPVRQAGPQPVQAGGVNAADEAPDLARAGGPEVTQTNHGSMVQAAARKVRVPRPDQLIPVRDERVHPGADPAHQDGLVGTGQRREDHRGSDLTKPAASRRGSSTTSPGFTDRARV